MVHSIVVTGSDMAVVLLCVTAREQFDKREHPNIFSSPKIVKHDVGVGHLTENEMNIDCPYVFFFFYVVSEFQN